MLKMQPALYTAREIGMLDEQDVGKIEMNCLEFQIGYLSWETAYNPLYGSASHVSSLMLPIDPEGCALTL